jgi:hypothetical protein
VSSYKPALHCTLYSCWVLRNCLPLRARISPPWKHLSNSASSMKETPSPPLKVNSSPPSKLVSHELESHSHKLLVRARTACCSRCARRTPQHHYSIQNSCVLAKAVHERQENGARSITSFTRNKTIQFSIIKQSIRINSIYYTTMNAPPPVFLCPQLPQSTLQVIAPWVPYFVNQSSVHNSSSIHSSPPLIRSVTPTS